MALIVVHRGTWWYNELKAVSTTMEKPLLPPRGSLPTGAQKITIQVHWFARIQRVQIFLFFSSVWGIFPGYLLHVGAHLYFAEF